jgi:dTDP-4-amino-4,6-dideoxygalactose transaminase
MSQAALPPLPGFKLSFAHDQISRIGADIEALFRTGNISQGSAITRFENTFAGRIGAPYAVALSSGGVALEAAMMALRPEPGAEFLVPANTFYATAAAVRSAGTIPKLIDVDEHFGMPRIDQVERAISSRTAGVVIVHIGGVVKPRYPGH